MIQECIAAAAAVRSFLVRHDVNVRNEKSEENETNDEPNESHERSESNIHDECLESCCHLWECYVEYKTIWSGGI